MTPTATWTGCYESSWKDIITAKSTSHPAKFSRGLIERIVEHGFMRGYWTHGSTVLDPFAGAGCGGIVCAARGLRWTGVELEQSWVDVARENLRINKHLFEFPPRIMQGDSRFMRAEESLVSAVITSSPYADALSTPTHGTGDERRMRNPDDTQHTSYGSTPGNLGNTKGTKFWQALRDVFAQCHAVLKPGGVLVCVMGNHVKDDKIVDLCGDTLRLLESIGFTTLERIVASNVTETHHSGLFGKIVHRVERTSFYRKLANAKGPPIYGEEVLIVEK